MLKLSTDGRVRSYVGACDVRSAIRGFRRLGWNLFQVYSNHNKQLCLEIGRQPWVKPGEIVVYDDRRLLTENPDFSQYNGWRPDR